MTQTNCKETFKAIHFLYVRRQRSQPVIQVRNHTQTSGAPSEGWHSAGLAQDKASSMLSEILLSILIPYKFDNLSRQLDFIYLIIKYTYRKIKLQYSLPSRAEWPDFPPPPIKIKTLIVIELNYKSGP